MHVMPKTDIMQIIETCEKTINVTEFGADPTGENDSTMAIWKALAHAKKINGHVMIDFPTGVYQLQKGASQVREYHTSNTNSIEYPEKTIALLIEDQEDVILNGNGSLFMINGDCMALAVVRSKNTHLYNFSWDFTVPTTIEMRVTDTGIINCREYTDIFIPDCFPYSIDANQVDVTWYSEMDPVNGKYYWTDKNHKNAWTLVGYHLDRNITRRYSLETGPFSSSRKEIEQINESTIRIFYENRPFIHKKGLIFEFCSTPKRETAGAFIWESQNTIIEKVNVHYMHAFGWLTQMSHDVSYYDCHFKARRESGRYTSSYADLIHVSGASGHITVEDCSFHHAHDDPINVHGTFTRVHKKINNYTIQLKYIQRQQGGFPQYYIGNEVIFYRRDTMTPGADGGRIYHVQAVTYPGEGGNDLKTMTVTFDQPVPDEIYEQIDGEPAYVAENITYTPTVHIKNNHFETISTRGILCTTRRKIVIENNTFKHMAMDAIYLSNDSRDWYESGPIKEAIIRNNTFYVTKVGGANWRNAAIRIDPITFNNEIPDEDNPIHKNITIENNCFYMEHESVLSAKSTDGLTFVHNQINGYKPAYNQMNGNTILGEETPKKTTKHLFELTSCGNVVISNNQYVKTIEPTIIFSGMSEKQVIEPKVKHDRKSNKK